MTDYICYCFAHTAADIRADVLAHDGRSEIMAQIVAAKKQGACRCEQKHPEGR